MSDIPIMFSGTMVQALLAGRKTMTRRLAWRLTDVGDNHTRTPTPWQRVKPGDRLWLRENFWRWGRWLATKKAGKTSYRFEALREPSDLPDVIYAADAAPDRDAAGRESPPVHGKFADREPAWHLRPNIFLERQHSRLTLIVTATKIERLQKITEADAAAEGWTKHPEFGTDPEIHRDAARDWFSDLWGELHGVESWRANPEVVAITFTVHKQNIDATEPGK